MDLIYLDHAASTPLDPEVARGLAERERTLFANPSASHPAGARARRAIETSRRIIAEGLGGRPDQLTFTSGGTEAMAIALLGLVEGRGHHAVYTAGEHPCTRAPLARLARLQDWTLSEVGLARDGRVDLAALDAALTPETRLVAVMLANNETGALNPMAEVVQAVRHRSPRALLVVDVTQAIGKLPVRVDTLDADAVAFSGHKFHGPKGIGALWSRAPVRPLMAGGGQEGGRRGGTQPAPLIWALGAAFERAVQTLPESMPWMTHLRDRLVEGLRQRCPELTIAGPAEADQRLCNVAMIHLPGIPGGPLLNALGERGVCASAGSACGGGAFSSVLSAMGYAPDGGAWLRLSVSRLSTEAEVDAGIEAIGATLEALQGAAHLTR